MKTFAGLLSGPYAYIWQRFSIVFVLPPGKNVIWVYAAGTPGGRVAGALPPGVCDAHTGWEQMVYGVVSTGLQSNIFSTGLLTNIFSI